MEFRFEFVEDVKKLRKEIEQLLACVEILEGDCEDITIETCRSLESYGRGVAKMATAINRKNLEFWDLSE